ncbi:MAG: hypothetical protein WD176_06905, partial [Pirellulales bacterium]
NPDTSFLAKIPADTPFTFQTLDRDGLMLNMAQTWHQVRPGEIRTNCGGCHAHSQPPTPFEQTLAARPDYKLWDLTTKTPLVTAKDRDESGKKWDAQDTTGVRTVEAAVVDVEYRRDVMPILKRSCTACHTASDGRTPPAGLVLDADDHRETVENRPAVPASYYRLAADERAKYGHKPVGWDSWGYPQASRYVRMFQSRRSLLRWKIFGRRLDGFSNDDHPSEKTPGDGTLVHRGKPVDVERHRAAQDIDFTGSIMPPPEAVAGTYKGPDGKPVHVAALTDEDRRTLARWIDLGCPIDLDHDGKESYGWFADDNRPVLHVNVPRDGEKDTLNRIVVGAFDYYSALRPDSLIVQADFPIDGIAPGTNLASEFRQHSTGVWHYTFKTPVTPPPNARLTVSIEDRRGNETRIERTLRNR